MRQRGLARSAQQELLEVRQQQQEADSHVQLLQVRVRVKADCC